MKGVINSFSVEVFQYAFDQIHRIKVEIEHAARMHVLNVKALNFDSLCRFTKKLPVFTNRWLDLAAATGAMIQVAAQVKARFGGPFSSHHSSWSSAPYPRPGLDVPENHHLVFWISPIRMDEWLVPWLRR